MIRTPHLPGEVRPSSELGYQIVSYLAAAQAVPARALLAFMLLVASFWTSLAVAYAVVGLPVLTSGTGLTMALSVGRKLCLLATGMGPRGIRGMLLVPLPWIFWISGAAAHRLWRNTVEVARENIRVDHRRQEVTAQILQLVEDELDEEWVVRALEGLACRSSRGGLTLCDITLRNAYDEKDALLEERAGFPPGLDGPVLEEWHMRNDAADHRIRLALLRGRQAELQTANGRRPPYLDRRRARGMLGMALGRAAQGEFGLQDRSVAQTEVVRKWCRDKAREKGVRDVDMAGVLEYAIVAYYTPQRDMIAARQATASDAFRDLRADWERKWVWGWKSMWLFSIPWPIPLMHPGAN